MSKRTLEDMVTEAYIYAAKMKLGLVRVATGHKGPVPKCECGKCRECKHRIKYVAWRQAKTEKQRQKRAMRAAA
jgi:hypothetical protein